MSQRSFEPRNRSAAGNTVRAPDVLHPSGMFLIGCLERDARFFALKTSVRILTRSMCKERDEALTSGRGPYG